MSAFHRAAPGRILHIRASPIRVSPSSFAQTTRARSRPSPSLGRRNFHLGAIAESIGGAAVWTAGSISSIHHAGVPWYLTIPLVALGVNFTVRLPLQYYVRRLALKRSGLQPLVSAWNSRHSGAILGQTGKPPTIPERRQVYRLSAKSQSRIYKNFSVQRWKGFTALSSIGFFVIVSDALRSLCGASTFWVGYFMGMEKTEKVSSALADPTAASLFEPSLTDGGCFWFVDLTAMDPYYALPVICSGLLARMTWGKLTKEQLMILLAIDRANLPMTPMARAGRAIQRLMLLIPFYPLAFTHLPSAVFLYWASTFALSSVNDVICNKVLVKKEFPSSKVSFKPPEVFPYIRGSGVGPVKDVKQQES